MAAIDILLIPGLGPWTKGRETARRQVRALLLYGMMWLVGLGLWALATTSATKAFGLGLWCPGFGFFSVGGWWLIAVPVTLTLFLAAIFIWFAAGALLLPLLIWVGSAFGAAWVAASHQHAWSWAPWCATTTLLLAIVANSRWRLRRNRADLARRHARSATQIEAMQLAEKAAVAPRPVPSERELLASQLPSVRYLIDRALQPLEEFNGFNSIDIFQTASLRYQINLLGYAIALLHCAYTPAFRGYSAEAQRRLIDKARLPRVWNYWIYETLWGRFNLDFDPADEANVMLTGYYGAQVVLYGKTTGDHRYESKGSLTFRLTKSLAYRHDVHSVVRSITKNLDKSPFCLFACEPNWIYPVCNFRAMGTLAAYDSYYGTDLLRQRMGRWLTHLESEFTSRAGPIIGLRSALTGVAFPFPSGDLDFAVMASAFAPDLAARLWALGRFQISPLIQAVDGGEQFVIPNAGVDYGNYKAGNRALIMAAVLIAAREFGDDRIALAARNTLDHQCMLAERDGVRSYGSGSNLTNILAAQGILMQRGDYRAVFAGPSTASAGPVLQAVDYPTVLVCRAYSDASALDLTLQVRDSALRTTLQFAQLRPRQTYRCSLGNLSVMADDQGCAALDVTLQGRVSLKVTPA